MQYLKSIEKFVTNKTVFCGIDIHKERWNLCYLSDGEVLETTVIEGEADQLIRHTQRKYLTAKKVHFVYEAGFSGFYLYRDLIVKGYQCTITPPNRIPSMHDKVKTDKRDAQQLARYLSGGLLKEIFVPPLSSEADRQLLRLRADKQKDLTRVKNKIKSHLNLHGIKWSKEDGNKWTKAYLHWLAGIEFKNPGLRLILDILLKDFHFIRDQIADITKEIRAMSKSEAYSKKFNYLAACKGIGLITAMTYLLELHDVIRFSSGEKLSSYLGLTPSQYSTGKHVRLGHITREGNAHVRRVLVESAWTVIRYDPFLREKYERIRAKGTNGKKAIVAVARSLAVRLRRCLLDETPYETGIC